MQNYMVQISNKSIINWTRKLRVQRSLTNLLPLTVAMEKQNVRWAFNVTAWEPSRDEMLTASSCIQPEERQRISQYVFQDDAKASLVGRLLMRKFIHLSMVIPYEEIRLGRDRHGKPYLLDSMLMPSFNVSHHGDYTVLAGCVRAKIGVDVMTIEPPVNKNIPDFFRIMNRQFSHHEWSTIHSFPTEMQQVACFNRMWCLKESYVKNIGMGITIPLDEISFSVQTPLKTNEIVTDTKIYVKGELKKDFVFEETLLDEKHAVAVSLQTWRDVNYKPVAFQFLNFYDLVSEAVPIQEPDGVFTDNMLIKKVKQFKTADH